MPKIIIFIVIILTFAGAVFWYFNRPSPGTPLIVGEEVSKPKEVKISIKNFSFSPKDIFIKVGTTVKWTNEDSVGHTATSQGNFDSGIISNGQSFSHTFNQSGVFDYICAPHPFMIGQITVE